MSIHRLTLLYCDGENCPRDDDREQVPFDINGLGTGADQRSAAKEDGWIRRNGKDYCPKCAERMRAAIGRGEANK